jgi:hypothetical protein
VFADNEMAPITSYGCGEGNALSGLWRPTLVSPACPASRAPTSLTPIEERTG